MRLAALLLIAACAAAPLAPSPARAAPLRAPALATAPSAAIVDIAGPRCGPRAHYVRGHRARNGQWIKGRCIRDKRRR
jgi:hypothetical protein